MIAEECALTDLFPESHYPRRAQFSRSGRWLIVIARDFRVVFVRVNPNASGGDIFGERIYARAHTGPVMCVDSGARPFVAAKVSPPDRFYTAGYDGRVVMWTERRDAKEAWSKPALAHHLATGSQGQRDIIRALVADLPSGSNLGDGLWIGTEIDCWLRYYRVADGDDPREDELVEDPALGIHLDDGVFCLAIEEQGKLLAIGLASGDILVLERSSAEGFDGQRPSLALPHRWRDRPGDPFRRGWQMFAGDRLGRCAVQVQPGGSAGDPQRTPVRSFVYPESQWLPHLDTRNLELSPDVDLERSRGLSVRMKKYLQSVGRACAEGVSHAERG